MIASTGSSCIWLGYRPEEYFDVAMNITTDSCITCTWSISFFCLHFPRRIEYFRLNEWKFRLIVVFVTGSGEERPWCLSPLGAPSWNGNLLLSYSLIPWSSHSSLLFSFRFTSLPSDTTHMYIQPSLFISINSLQMASSVRANYMPPSTSVTPRKRKRNGNQYAKGKYRNSKVSIIPECSI